MKNWIFALRGMQLTEFGSRQLPLARRATLEVSRFTHEAKALSGGIEEWLGARRIDIGLVFARQTVANTGDTPLASSNLHLVGPAGDTVTSKRAVTLAQAAKCSIMLPGRPHSVRTMVDEACSKAHGELRLLCEIDSLLAIKEVVASGCGYTISGYDSVTNDVLAGRLQAAPIKEPSISRLLVMRLGSKPSITTAALTVADFISIAQHLIRHPSGACASGRPAIGTCRSRG